MSNFLAIATATAALSNLLLRALREDLPDEDIDVTNERPEELETGLAKPTVNVFLYQVTPNQAYRNADLPTRNGDGQVVRRAQAAINLHYLLTFFGNDKQLVPQRLLGSVVRTLHVHPLLTSQDIDNALAAVMGGNAQHFFRDSDLAQQVERVKFSPLILNLEELSKLWSVFFQTAYRLSIAYEASVILIDGKEAPRTAPPVLERNVHGTDMPPAIEKLLSQKEGQPIALENQPIVPNDILVIAGVRLRRDHTFLRFNAKLISSDKFIELSDGQIKIKLDQATLAEELRTGRHGVQVLHQIRFVENGEPHNVLESNPVFFTLRPEVTAVEVTE